MCYYNMQINVKTSDTPLLWQDAGSIGTKLKLPMETLLNVGPGLIFDATHLFQCSLTADTEHDEHRPEWCSCVDSQCFSVKYH